MLKSAMEYVGTNDVRIEKFIGRQMNITMDALAVQPVKAAMVWVAFLNAVKMQSRPLVKGAIARLRTLACSR